MRLTRRLLRRSRPARQPLTGCRRHTVPLVLYAAGILDLLCCVNLTPIGVAPGGQTCLGRGPITPTPTFRIPTHRRARCRSPAPCRREVREWSAPANRPTAATPARRVS